MQNYLYANTRISRRHLSELLSSRIPSKSLNDSTAPLSCSALRLWVYLHFVPTRMTTPSVKTITMIDKGRIASSLDVVGATVDQALQDLEMAGFLMCQKYDTRHYNIMLYQDAYAVTTGYISTPLNMAEKIFQKHSVHHVRAELRSLLDVHGQQTIKIEYRLKEFKMRGHISRLSLGGIKDDPVFKYEMKNGLLSVSLKEGYILYNAVQKSIDKGKEIISTALENMKNRKIAEKRLNTKVIQDIYSLSYRYSCDIIKKAIDRYDRILEIKQFVISRSQDPVDQIIQLNLSGEDSIPLSRTEELENLLRIVQKHEIRNPAAYIRVLCESLCSGRQSYYDDLLHYIMA